ncbi:class I SAM-dependent methyltransferase [Bradyrhizobium sp. JR3.5]
MTDDAPGRALQRLHIGAFNCGIEGWINTDITMHLWIARVPLAAKALHLAGLLSAARYAEHRQGKFAALRYMDLTKPLPFADGSLAAVFSAHVFEHLFPDEVERLAREIARVLAPGGVCRIVVPDMERIVALYDPAAPAGLPQGRVRDRAPQGGRLRASLGLYARLPRGAVPRRGLFRDPHPGLSRRHLPRHRPARQPAGRVDLL